MTKPSGRASNGREMPLSDSASSAAKPARAIPVSAASDPPATTASASPPCTARTAAPRAWAPAARGGGGGGGGAGARRAGGHDAEGGAAQVVAHGDCRRARVAHHERHDE